MPAPDYWTPAVLDPAYRLGLVESYFLKLNEPSGKWAAWIKFTFLIRKGGAAPAAECWFIFFDRDAVTGRKVSAWKQAFGDGDWRIRKQEIEISMGCNVLSQKRSCGVLGNGAATWDFEFSSPSSALVISPPFALSPLLPTTKLTSPVPKGLATGVVTVGGKRFQFTDHALNVGHNWGHSHATAYAWGQARAGGAGETGEEFFFEGASLPLGGGFEGGRFLTLGRVLLDGEAISFAGPQSWLKARAEVSVGSWRFEMRNRAWKLEGDFSLDSEYVAGLKYVQPNGHVQSCLNSMIADARLELSRLKKGSSSRTFRADGTAALEYLTPGLSQDFEMLT